MEQRGLARKPRRARAAGPTVCARHRARGGKCRCVDRLPLIDADLAREMFSGADEAEQADLRQILGELVADIAPRLRAVAELADRTAGDDRTATRELHQIRGAVANFGLKAAADYFRELEDAWSQWDVVRRRQSLMAGEAALQDGLVELRSLYPFLAGV